MSPKAFRRCGVRSNGDRHLTGQRDTLDEGQMLDQIWGDRPDEIAETDSRNHAGSDRVRSVQQKTETESNEQLFDNRILKVNVTVPSPNDPFSEEEAAAYLGLPKDTLRYYALRTCEIAYCDFGKGRRTYLRKDLDELLARRREPSIREKAKARLREKGAET